MTPRNDGPSPLQGGPAESFGAERASATPSALRKSHRALKRHPVASTVRPTQVGKTPLAPLQRWFHSIITHPGSVDDGLSRAHADLPEVSTSLTDVLSGAPNLSIHDRLGIYHYAYYARLIDCLADDYPTVKHAMGEEPFSALCRTVITKHPSRHPNLNAYGRALLDHCQSQTLRIKNRSFISQLAQLEWSMTEVFHAQPAPTLSIEELRRIPLEQWAEMSFAASPTARVLTFTYPVNQYLQAFRDDQSPSIPRPRPSATAVYRLGYRIWRMDLTPSMATLLHQLLAGQTLGNALDNLAKDQSDQQELIPMVMRWFNEWVSGGFFTVTPGH